MATEETRDLIRLLTPVSKLYTGKQVRVFVPLQNAKIKQIILVERLFVISLVVLIYSQILFLHFKFFSSMSELFLNKVVIHIEMITLNSGDFNQCKKKQRHI